MVAKRIKYLEAIIRKKYKDIVKLKILLAAHKTREIPKILITLFHKKFNQYPSLDIVECLIPNIGKVSDEDILAMRDEEFDVTLKTRNFGNMTDFRVEKGLMSKHDLIEYIYALMPSELEEEADEEENKKYDKDDDEDDDKLG